MNGWIQQYLLQLEELPFAQQGASLKSVLADVSALQIRYREWRYSVLVELFIRALPDDACIELSIDYDLDEGLADFWGLSLMLEHEYYLPAHWLMESFTGISNSVWGAEWQSWTENLASAKVEITEETWAGFQMLKGLVEEDLAYWSERVLFFDSAEMETK